LQSNNFERTAQWNPIETESLPEIIKFYMVRLAPLPNRLFSI
jgi:hypothetical protein